jgi:protein-S-isoprenylcysteine O-methyltransferase Ste14
MTAAVTALAFLVFALLHSITVSSAFKGFVAKFAGERWMRAWYRLAFTVFSFVTAFAAAYIIWTQPDTTFFTPPWYVSWPAHAVQLAGVFIMFEAMRPFSAGYFSGWKQASEYLKTGRTGGDIEGIADNTLVTTGVYGLVRHPMYLAGIMIFLFEPVITANNLALRAFAVAYFIWGGYIEERRFAPAFGDAYQEYRRKVPMYNLIAGLIRKTRNVP